MPLRPLRDRERSTVLSRQTEVVDADLGVGSLAVIFVSEAAADADGIRAPLRNIALVPVEGRQNRPRLQLFVCRGRSALIQPGRRLQKKIEKFARQARTRAASFPPICLGRLPWARNQIRRLRPWRPTVLLSLEFFAAREDSWGSAESSALLTCGPLRSCEVLISAIREIRGFMWLRLRRARSTWHWLPGYSYRPASRPRSTCRESSR